MDTHQKSRFIKNSVLGWGIALLIAIIMFWLLRKPEKTNIPQDEIAFALKDTAQLHEIVISAYFNERLVNKATLTRKQGTWWVNNNYPAHPDKMQLLLQTIHDIQMRQPLHPNAKANVLQLIRKRNLHILLKSSNQTKSYTLGPATPDTKGNFAILENAQNPYIVELPGFSGYLSARFSAEPNSWRDLTLWSIPFSQFKLYQIADKQQTLVSLHNASGRLSLNDQPLKDTLQQQFIEQHLLRFSAFATTEFTYPNAIDSLPSIPPDYTLKINDLQFKLWKATEGSLFIQPTQPIPTGKLFLISSTSFQKLLLQNPLPN